MGFKEYVASLQTSLLLVLGSMLAFKEVLADRNTEAAAVRIDSSVVPEGEIWEIRNIRFHDTVAGVIGIYLVIEGALYILQEEAAANQIIWHGVIYAEEGQMISGTGPNGGLVLTVLGVKQHTPEALEDLLHKTRAIMPERDVQASGVRPDPMM